MELRSAAVLGLFASLVVAGRGVAAQPAPGEAIDAETRRRLDSGELVTSPIEERRGALRLLGGTSMKVIDVPPSEVWSALEHARDLGEMIPGDTTVRETFRAGNERGALVRHGDGPIEATYHVRLTFDARKRMLVFRLDESHPSRLRAGWGFVKLSAWSGGKTLIRFGALVDVGSGLVTGLMRPTLQRAMLAVPREIERYLARCAREPSRCYRADRVPTDVGSPRASWSRSTSAIRSTVTGLKRTSATRRRSAIARSLGRALPVVMSTTREGSISRARRTSSSPSTPGMSRSVTSASNAKGVLERAAIAAAASVTASTS